MNKTKIILWLLVIIFIVFTFVAFTNTLALFETNASGELDNEIGKWIIKINNSIISSSIQEDIVIDDFIYEQVSTIESGYIAPGSSAYSDIIFDATDCDVAVRYDISFNYELMNYADNIIVTVAELGNNNIVMTSENTYSGIISLESINNNDLISLRVSVVWNDIEDYNDDDTSLGTVRNNKLQIPITVHAEQYLGEELIPYNG